MTLIATLVGSLNTEDKNPIGTKAELLYSLTPRRGSHQVTAEAQRQGSMGKLAMLFFMSLLFRERTSIPC